MPPFTGVAVKSTDDPEHIVLDGAAATLTDDVPDEITDTDKVCTVPVHPAALVSFTEMFPLVLPNVTLILLEYWPTSILVPDGTVHVYIELIVFVTE